MFHVKQWQSETAEFEAWVRYITDRFMATQDDLGQIWREPRRARRIRDKQRMKRRARWVAKTIWNYRPADLHAAAKVADHLKTCSCWMCGHQRKWHGPNMQERRERLKADVPRETLKGFRTAPE